MVFGFSSLLSTIFNLFTFPGIIIHEIAHVLFCNITRTKVQSFNLFGNGISFFLTRCGHVTYDVPENAKKQLAISFGPMVFNSFITIITVFVAIALSYYIPLISWFLLWLAFSIGAHAFPSSLDGNALSRITKDEIKNNKLLALLYAPFSLFAYLAQYATVLWVDAIYSMMLIASIVLAIGQPFFWNLGDGIILNIEYNTSLKEIVPVVAFDDSPIFLDTCTEKNMTHYSCSTEKIPKSAIADDRDHIVRALIGNDCRAWNITDHELKTSTFYITLDSKKGNLLQETDCADLSIKGALLRME